MRWVECPAIRPQRCAVIPFLGSDPGGFIDTGSELDGFDNHVYVSLTAVREMARFVGLPTVGELTAATAERDRLALEVADLREQLEQADKELGAVYTLKAKGWSQGAKPGRPRKEAV